MSDLHRIWTILPPYQHQESEKLYEIDAFNSRMSDFCTVGYVFNEGNAKAIAAVPKMYKALKELIPFLLDKPCCSQAAAKIHEVLKEFDDYQ